MNRTFVMLKPDAVERRLIGTIITRFEEAGYTIEAMELTTLDETAVAAHYIEHVGKAFYSDLRDFTLSGPIVRLSLSREDAVAGAREMLGATNPVKAEPGTIRGDLHDDSGIIRRNLAHASDSPAAAQRELALHFPRLYG